MDRSRNFYIKEDLGDPLNPNDFENFDIVDFVTAADETPVDSPDFRQGAAMNNLQHQQHVPDPHHGQIMYSQRAGQNPMDSSLDTPPISDSGSGSGSSASPSSTDHAYSPESYPYSVMPNNAHYDPMINMMINPAIIQDVPRVPMMPQQNMQSPQGLFSPYPTQHTPSTLPSPQPGMRPEFGMHPPYLFDNNMDPAFLASRKRPRMESAEETKVFAHPTNLPQSMNNNGYEDSFHTTQQVIKFSPFEKETWLPVYGESRNQLKELTVVVVADKGFNYIPSDQVFVNQKKNHFQISVHIEAKDPEAPTYIVRNGGLQRIVEFKLAFCGVKAEMPNSVIQIKQSQTDRKPIPHAPVVLEVKPQQVTKVTVPRLHFNETTLNNQRKNNKLNPDQKYFLLVVRLLATAEDGTEHLVQAYQSERVVVRATNPGSFNPDENEPTWQRNGSALYTNNPVVVGGEKPINDAKLTVNGNLVVTGKTTAPSDRRLKEGIVPVDSRDAMQNVQKLSVCRYSYKPEVAMSWGMNDQERSRMGLIAQELEQVLPDAVKDIGEYLTIDENRVFYETLLATQELCRLTDNLDNKIDEKVEEISRRIAIYAHNKKMRSSMASGLCSEAGADNRSMLSISRSSLASFSYKRNRKNDRCKSNCSRPEPLCGSKLTQVTITSLVVVMTVCLLVMSGLYVLDWYNRNYPVQYVSRPPFANPDDALGEMKAHPYLPMIQPDAPPLLSTCSSGYCHSYCCNQSGSAKIERSEWNQEDQDGSRPPHETSPAKPLSSGVMITIPMLNATIDHRYCITNSCKKSHGRYNLYIPVSPYVPTTPLELHFNVPKGKILNNCGYLSEFKQLKCSYSDGWDEDLSIHTPTSDQVAENIYELSIGHYLQSAYRFRVGYSTESCYSSETHLNGVFEEYNLVFYRTCSSNAPATDPTSILSHNKR